MPSAYPMHEVEDLLPQPCEEIIDSYTKELLKKLESEEIYFDSINNLVSVIVYNM